VHQVQGELRGQAFDQRLEHAGVHGPAVQEHQVGAGAANVVVKLHCGGRTQIVTGRVGGFTASARAASRPSTSASLWSTERVMRSRAWPSGTVGGRMAVTR